MLEIQDAAKIITESIDPNAKVIFGAIKDDKLKKGDIKITVIATGFGDGATNLIHKRLFDAADKDKNKIFNSMTPAAKEEKVSEKDKKEEKKTLPTIEEDDWGAVPSFLRRKK